MHHDSYGLRIEASPKSFYFDHNTSLMFACFENLKQLAPWVRRVSDDPGCFGPVSPAVNVL